MLKPPPRTTLKPKKTKRRLCCQITTPRTVHGEPRNPQLPKFSQRFGSKPPARIHPQEKTNISWVEIFQPWMSRCFCFNKQNLVIFSVSHVSELRGLTIRFNRGSNWHTQESDDDGLSLGEVRLLWVCSTTCVCVFFNVCFVPLLKKEGLSESFFCCFCCISWHDDPNFACWMLSTIKTYSPTGFFQLWPFSEVLSDIFRTFQGRKVTYIWGIKRSFGRSWQMAV